MDNDSTFLARIAEALERLSPKPADRPDWYGASAFVWKPGGARSIDTIIAPDLALLRGIDRQKQLVVDNVHRLSQGKAAHDMLLWGARGTGKSALVKASIADAQAQGGSLALVQIGPDALTSLPDLFVELQSVDRNFLVFIDDLGFAEGDTITPRYLRSWLDGGVEARPANVRLAVTSNRRAILPRHLDEQDDPINPRDAVDDQLALADRFGLSLGFHTADQDDFLDMLRGYASKYDLQLDEADALQWAKRRGARSGRIAWHYITELAGRAGRTLP